MCGFIGRLEKNTVASCLPLEFLKHRGPDASGEWLSPNGLCWLGHVRLSILELTEAGAQPMVSASGKSVIVFNGEIYNHKEIRQRIDGIPWRGHSDTETLLEAWERLGAACLEQIHGMFAFAAYDTQSGTLHLVRDRMGIKPLYYRNEGHSALAFASEARALIRGARPNLSSSALPCYLATGHTPSEGEVGEGIEILPPASILSRDREGKQTLQQWWRMTKRPALGGHSSRQEICAHVRSHVEKSVEEHLISDVPVGSFLSGGIDSSIVALLAARQIGKSLRTFCVGFPNIGFDERAIARVVAEHAGSQHSEIEVGPTDCQQWVMEAVAAMDMPSADAINTFIVSKAVRQAGLKVALSGLGGDELFCGYPSFWEIPRLSFLGKIPPTLVRSLVSFSPSGVRDKFEGAPSFDAFTLALLRRRWWSNRHLKLAGLKASVEWPKPPESFLDTTQAITQAEMLGYMEPMLLRDSDQMSMAVGLELRVPFLDHRLVEFVMALPEKWKRGKPPKRLLIDAFADILPQEVWNRPKQGFALPMDAWMRGPLRDFCREGIELARQQLDRTFLEFAVQGFEKRSLHWTRLWQLVVFGHYSGK